MGNRPKMSLKYAIFKICQNLPENDNLMKQKSVPPFLGIVGDKKWSPFFDLGIPSPIFLHPKTAIFSDFGCKKMGLGMPKSKNGDYPQKRWNRLLFHMNIIFGRVLGKFWKSRILGSFLADFPLQNPPTQKWLDMDHLWLYKFEEKKFLGPSYHGTGWHNLWGYRGS